MSRKFEARKKAHEQAVTKAKATGMKPPPLQEMPYSNRLNVRDYHHKKTASIIASRYRGAVEEHGLQFIIRNRRQAKAASDRAIGNRKLLLQSKLGARCVKTSNRRPGNSRSCVRGETVAKEPKDRVHVCPSCKLVADRDYVSANIVTLSRGPGRISPDVGNAKSCAARAVARSVVLMHQAVEAAPRMGNLPRRARPVSITGHSPPAVVRNPSYSPPVGCPLFQCREKVTGMDGDDFTLQERSARLVAFGRWAIPATSLTSAV